MSLTCVEFDHFSLEVRWHREGRYYPASGTSPATMPVPRVESCVLRLGEYTAIVPFDQLPENAQGYVIDELLAEISGEQFDHELNPDFAELL